MRMLIVAAMLWASAAHADKSKQIDVIARVVDAPPGPIICGVIANVGVVRYEVIAVKAGHYPSRDLFVAFMCPESVDNGQVDRLVLEPVNKSTQFEDRFKGTPGTRYRVIRHKRIRKA